ncbi:heterokaryon incompatibility protein-domain-containing protein [Hypoxylon crocopeplum]|nr:heterokaryon incompatibility protein-domain-containing protein [Hypoxylon crocopeplum]
MSVYTNNLLLQGQTQIRVLRILPGQPTDDIKCIFDTVSLDGGTRYQALSYEWGPKASSRVIHVMGQPKTVRLNLWNFLSRLRSRGYHDYLWCDAICIDQANDHERNHQVQWMAQIYRKAHSVLVWLGEDSEDSNITLRTIRLVSTCADRESRSAYLEERQIVWQGLTQLSRRRYWTRIWIVQEITVARDAQLFCGEEMVPWTAFAAACKFRPEEVIPWRSELWAPFPDVESEKQTIRLDTSRKIYRSAMYGLIRSQKRWPQHVEPFEDLYTRYREFGCEDSRDRFFALFGIAKEVVLQRGFSVDYRKDNLETFISLVSWAVGGAIKIASGRKFIHIAAEVMGFQWSDYPTEFCIDPKPKWSPVFLKWATQPLAISLRCYRCSTNARFTIFRIAASSVYLRCNPTGRNSWTVVGRHDGSRWVNSIFTGVGIVADKPDNYFIGLKNVAQFIEIFLAYAYTGGGGWGGSWILQYPARVKQPAADKGLAELLSSVKIKRSVELVTRGAEEADIDMDEMPDGCETFAKPRVLTPPVEKPEWRQAGTSLVVSRGGRPLDSLHAPVETGLGRVRGLDIPLFGGFLRAEP